MRLWNEISDTSKDYYVAEGKLDGGSEEGEGLPSSYYFVQFCFLK